MYFIIKYCMFHHLTYLCGHDVTLLIRAFFADDDVQLESVSATLLFHLPGLPGLPGPPGLWSVGEFSLPWGCL